jgi:hypothetical protein
VPEALALLTAVKSGAGSTSEIKWKRGSKFKLHYYKQYADVFFTLAACGKAHFQALYVDSHTFNHRQWNRGDADLGFNKLIYQLLLHRFGRRHGASHLIHAYLDKRTTRHDPEEMRPMLNHDLSRRWQIDGRPFRRVWFRDSDKCHLLQLNDLLIGSIGYLRNVMHKRAEAADHKTDLAWHITRQAIELERPFKVNSKQAKRFAVWPFAFKHGGVLKP